MSDDEVHSTHLIPNKMAELNSNAIGVWKGKKKIQSYYIMYKGAGGNLVEVNLGGCYY
jgi:hypothetical protein